MPLSEFDDLVAQLVGFGYSRPEAEKAVREQHPHLAPKIDVDRDNVLEKQEQHEIVKLLRGFNFHVYTLSQARASKQTPGLPDIWFARESVAGWFEVKRSEGGRLSSAQEEFRDECQRAGVLHVVGDRSHAQQLLVDLGLAIRIENRIEPAHLYQRSG
jgi:hypothetical protein